MTRVFTANLLSDMTNKETSVNFKNVGSYLRGPVSSEVNLFCVWVFVMVLVCFNPGLTIGVKDLYSFKRQSNLWASDTYSTQNITRDSMVAIFLGEPCEGGSA